MNITDRTKKMFGSDAIVVEVFSFKMTTAVLDEVSLTDHGLITQKTATSHNDIP